MGNQGSSPMAANIVRYRSEPPRALRTLGNVRADIPGGERKELHDS